MPGVCLSVCSSVCHGSAFTRQENGVAVDVDCLAASEKICVQVFET